MKKLRMLFSGLLGYVRSVHEGREKLTVVFPSVLNADTFPSNDPNHPITLPHFPFLSFDHKDFGESKRLPDIVLKGYAEPSLRYGLFLDSECLIVDSGGERRGVTFYKNPDVTDDQIEPNGELTGDAWVRQRMDYRWILGMEKVFPGCGRIDHDCTGANKVGLVFSRIEVYDGELTINRLVGEKDLGGGKKSATVYSLPAMGEIKEVKRVLAEEVMLEVDIKSDCGSVRFVSQQFGGGTRAEDLVLRAHGDFLYVNILNAELDQIVKPKGLTFDPHYARDLVILYELSQQRPSVGQRRFPGSEIIKGPSGSSGPAGDRICPGVFYNA